MKGEIEGVMEEIGGKGVKMGMMNDGEMVKVIGECIVKYDGE